MNFNDYQAQAMSFRLPTAGATYALLGLGGEAGEVQSVAAKGLRDGLMLDQDGERNYQAKMRKELGDCLWFIAAIARDNGLTLAEIAEANIDKLSGRQQRGTLQGSGDNR